MCSLTNAANPNAIIKHKYENTALTIPILIFQPTVSIFTNDGLGPIPFRMYTFSKYALCDFVYLTGPENH
jgi:hypothetical protein